MPQMSPYNWLILFFLLNIILIFIISMNHYMIMMNPMNKKKFDYKMKYYLYIWKW